MTEPADGEAAANLLHRIYVNELRIHAVTLIWLAYRRFNVGDFNVIEEDDITGELVRMLRLVLQDSTSPNWVEHYEVREQVPQNVGGILGKRRPKMDIELERHQRGPRPCLGFEAKRLGPSNPIGGYLGSEGLGAFLEGYYPTTHGEAGMLGYLQGPNADWATRLAKELSNNESQHRVVHGCEFEDCDVEPTMPAFRSTHTDFQGQTLIVIHVLLPFMCAN